MSKAVTKPKKLTRSQQLAKAKERLRGFRLEIDQIKERGLNPKQQMFCKLYASTEEFFASGVRAYAEAYDINFAIPNAYDIACSNASRLLRNDKILIKINELLELRGLNVPFVDKQLELLLTQNADFKTKLGAIKEYNSLKKRTEPGGTGNLGQVLGDILSRIEQNREKEMQKRQVRVIDVEPTSVTEANKGPTAPEVLPKSSRTTGDLVDSLLSKHGAKNAETKPRVSSVRSTVGSQTK